MARLDINRAGELEIFVQVVELESFSAVARMNDMTPSAISKLISRLEARLGVCLLHRSTRQLKLTAEGCYLYERALSILADLDEAEQTTAENAIPKGRIRISSNVPFGHHVLAPLVPKFLAQYPQITLDISLTDGVIDLLEHRVDIAVRAGELPDSNLLARHLTSYRMCIVAAPIYIKAHGLPTHPKSLTQHNLLGVNYRRTIHQWPFVDDENPDNNKKDHNDIWIPVAGNTQCSDGETLRHMALAGVGIARLAEFQVKNDIAQGKLVEILQDHHSQAFDESVYAVYAGKRDYLPSRIHVFLDFLQAHLATG